jgi:hypothetical protein
LERETAEGIVERNRSNFGYKEARLLTVEKTGDMKGLIK